MKFEDVVFAVNALRLGKLTEEQIQAGIAEMAKPGRSGNLPDIFLLKEVLTSAIVQEIRALGQDRVRCPQCQTMVTASDYTEGVSLQCPECSHVLLALDGSSASSRQRAISTASIKLSKTGGDPYLKAELNSCRLEEKLGEEDGCLIYRGELAGSNRETRVRIFPLKDSPYQDEFQAMRRRYEKAATLEHEAIAHPLDVGFSRDFFYAMDGVDGPPTLREKVEEDGPMRPGEAVVLALSVVDGLQVAHAIDLVHGGLSPDVLTIEGKTKRLRIRELGLARKHRLEGMRVTGRSFFGRPAYTGPEQLDGREPAPGSDIYSLGAVLHFAVTGRAPFEGETPLEIMRRVVAEPTPDLSSELSGEMGNRFARLLKRMMTKRIGDRYRDLAELQADLERLQGGKDLVPWTLDPAERDEEKDDTGHKRKKTGRLARGPGLFVTNLVLLLFLLLILWGLSAYQPMPNPLESYELKLPFLGGP